MQVDEKTFVVNSLMAWAAFLVWGMSLFNEWKYVTFTVRLGADRSLDQNALLHVWITEYVAYILKKDRRLVTKAEIEGMKKHIKKVFWAERREPWMVLNPINPKTGEVMPLQFQSSADYKVPEMFQFLSWLQMTAANDGLVLESRGQYAKLQREAL